MEHLRGVLSKDIACILTDGVADGVFEGIIA